ncbi:MAG: glycosyltransferase family 2 protein [Candidatus Kaiserbacteria bacterium]|nr:MAG: glycosyltransferase family 2 protein [Candidatus Kaiserbacteria bacterium]
MEIVTYVLLFVSLYFEVFLLLSFLERRRGVAIKKGPGAALLPSVAIVVPCFNEEDGVRSTLLSLLSLRYPSEKIEILLIDDGSTDRTVAVAQDLIAATPGAAERIKIFSKENGGKHTAMNFALERTETDLIGCLDADSVVDPHALSRIVQVLEDSAISAVTPGIHAKEPETWLQHMQHVEYRISIFNRFMLAALGSAFITPGPFSIFRTAVVRELGGWKYGHSTEDMELALRMQKHGHLIANAPSATVHTGIPRTFSGLFRQRVRWTYGFLKNAIDYRAMIFNRSYGNLGLLVLPLALFSIAAAIYFFCQMIFSAALSLMTTFTRIELTGTLPSPTLELFYINTSAMWILVIVSVALVLALIMAGSRIGTGSKRPPMGTPLFMLFYSFLVPLWLGAAVVRAIFNTGVRWR